MHGCNKPLILLLAVSCLGLVFGCSKPPKEAIRPPGVTVTLPVEKEVTNCLEYTGTTQAVEYVDIRARVVGFLDKIHFRPDDNVKAGDSLFTIDPRQYQAAVDQNMAELESRKAQYKLAQTEEEIAKSLEAQQALSWLKLQEKTAQTGVAKANIDLAQAALENSRLNLEWTKVTSPIKGRVSRNLVDVGNLVGATEKTLLTTVLDDSSIYCYFNVSELDLLAVKKAYGQQGGADRIAAKKIPAFLTLADGSTYPRAGYVDYADTKLNPSTGTIQVRSVFPNPDGFLLAGMFGRVRVALDMSKKLLVPELAVQFAQGGKYVLTVNDENVVAQKRIKVGQKVDDLIVVEEGLTPKDRVIIQGVQRARPGNRVNPSEAPAADPKVGTVPGKKE
jgi:membrane fusion protein, multidrug efflux system